MPRLVLLLPLSSACRPPHSLVPSMPPQGLFLLSSALGLEQLRNLRHLDVAYNLLEGHTELSPLWLLAELRKVRPACLPGLGAAFRSGRISGSLSLLFCPSALSGRQPLVVPPGTPCGHCSVPVTSGQRRCSWREWLPGVYPSLPVPPSPSLSARQRPSHPVVLLIPGGVAGRGLCLRHCRLLSLTQFLLDGEALSLEDLQVSLVGVG